MFERELNGNLILLHICLALLLLSSCDSSKVEKSNDKIADSNLISFSSVIQPLLDEDCSKCHDDLKKNDSYKLLTTKQSSCKFAPNYIDTANPTSSYLYIKLHDSLPPNGVLMQGNHWTPENVQKLLLWIEQGAKNN